MLSVSCISPHGPVPNVPRLTPRQAEILWFAAHGDTNADIAAALHISVRTVHAHLAHCYTTLGVTNRTKAATAAFGPTFRRREA
jgi:DNA-binding NarL/FixJ family response regulator